MTPAELCVQGARELLGVPWRHKGRNPVRGIDCIGLIVFAVAAGGIQMRDRTNYGREPWKDGLRGDIEAHFGAPVTAQAWRPGSVALLNWTVGDEQPAHVGILGNGTADVSLIHCFNSNGIMQTVEHDIDDRWRKLIVDVYWPWGDQ